MGLQNVTLLKTTEARVKACNDIRNAVGPFQGVCSTPELNFNVDFTQFNHTTADGTKTKAKVCGDFKGITLKGKPNPGQLLTCYFIKWFALISSSGIADDPLFFVDHMDPGKIDDHMDIDVLVVPGLSMSTYVGGSGTVEFCCSLCCNQKFFHWWFIETSERAV